VQSSQMNANPAYLSHCLVSQMQSCQHLYYYMGLWKSSSTIREITCRDGQVTNKSEVLVMA
jgi:hypothetical protein